MNMVNGQIPTHSGIAVIPFATWLSEDTVTVTGQLGLKADSKIQRSLVSDNDDVYAQDWFPPLIRNIVPDVGFDITIRPAAGVFKGPVSINWSWT